MTCQPTLQRGETRWSAIAQLHDMKAERPTRRKVCIGRAGVVFWQSYIPALRCVEVLMVRLLLTFTGCAVLTLGILSPLAAAPITIIPNTVNNFRDTRG